MVRTVRQKIFVAMSGGVDSSAAAALLKQQGHDLTGVFIKIEVANGCGWREERRDALRAAAVLRIPLLTLDLSREYKRSVIDYLVREYAAGRTPNPDVRCNKQIKFGAFFDEARRRGADLIATGHYARKQLLGSSCQLLASKDQNKDQTYFLWTLTPDILAHCLFPIGDYKKAEVRRLAEKFGLPNARKPDSQGLCFLGQIDFKDFLAQHLPKQKGVVLNEKGERIGEHDGAHLYTIGERHGFRVTAKTSASAPLYVIAKDLAKNILVVSNQPLTSASARKEISLNSVNWINNTPAPNKIIKTRIRYRAPLTSCRVKSLSNSRAQVTFLQPLFGPTPGQSCVFYDSRGRVCLGGGVIE
ncbi:MAG: tRNA 2-thiouridine(34) synthase MnmA [Candidatus Vogelbacteria bacterium]|nr:tRNA 2-thiouridine(34) synthase MnmA [Candidatus Vogelbacteria bacterium]